MKKIKYIYIVLVILLLAVGCKAEEQVDKPNEGAPSAVNSNNINLTMLNPETINPIINKEKSVGYVTNLIYDGLFTINENYDVVPQLVEEFGISEDGSYINIKLKDATWHDGTPITSSDVAFTVDFIKEYTDSPYNVFVKNISSVSIISKNELTIRFADKYAFSMDTLVFPIISKNQLSSVSNSMASEYKYNLIGNGPYKIENYKEREAITLVVNDNYYEELPKTIKNIKVSIVPDTESQVAMVTALQSDIANIGLNDLSKFQEDEFNITNYEGRDYEFILFNYDNPFLKDINFRKAIAHAINREQILEEGYMSDATIVNFPLNSKSKYYDESIKPLEFDKEKAKKYLEKVKPVTQNESNVDEKDSEISESDEATESTEPAEKSTQEKKETQATDEEIKKMISGLNLKIIVNKDNIDRKKSAYVIIDNLKAIGIKSTLVELSSEEIDKALSEKNYDLALLGWELPIVPDATEIIESCGFNDEKLTNYLTSLKNATSPSQIKDIYKSIQNYIKENVGFISLVIRDNYVVTNRRLEGKIIPNYYDVYEGISNLNITTKK